LILLGPFLLPQPNNEGARSERELADPDSHFVSLLGVDIHYKEMGQGDLVFLLYHGTAAHTFSWRKVMAPLARYGRVIAYDRPGFGLSSHLVDGEWKDPKNPYAPSRQPDIATALLDHLGVKKAVLVGNSNGGQMAIRTALKYPERVTALVSADADWLSTGIYPSGKYAWLWKTPQWRRLGVWLASKIFSWENAQMMIDLGYFNSTKFTQAEFAASAKYFGVKNYFHALWECAMANEPSRLPEEVKMISVPTLVIVGADDRVVPANDQALLADLITGAQLTIFNECGHLPQEEQPEKFVKAVIEFVDSLPRFSNRL